MEKALSWIADSKGICIEEYMAQMQNKANANELWLYFQNVISWVKTVFREYRREMKGLEWGLLYHSAIPSIPYATGNKIKFYSIETSRWADTASAKSNCEIVCGLV